LEERRRVNEQIRIPQIMVIGENGESLGLMTPDEGRRVAYEQGLDLVEVAPNARPPVCKIMDYGRFRYEQRKRTKKQHQTETKIIKLRPKTDPHDLETKLRHARRFIEDGDRVRFVVRMRGRERAVTERWVSQLNSLIDQLKDVATVIGPPTLEGGGVTATIEPRRGAAEKPAEKPAERPAAATAQAAPPAPPAPPRPSEATPPPGPSEG
jgi:translation initiation factor IF-3